MHVENAYQSVTSSAHLDDLLESIRGYLKKDYRREDLEYLRRIRQKAYDRKRFWKGDIVEQARMEKARSMVIVETPKPRVVTKAVTPMEEKPVNSNHEKRYSFTIVDKQGQTISYNFDNCSFTIEKKMNDELSLILTGSVGLNKTQEFG